MYVNLIIWPTCEFGSSTNVTTRQDLCLDSWWTCPGCSVKKIIGQNLTRSVWVWGTKWRSSRQITSILFPFTFAVSSTRQVLRCLPPCQALRCWWNLNDCLGVVVNRKNAMKSPNSRGNVRFETKHPTILAYLGNMAVMPCRCEPIGRPGRV